MGLLPFLKILHKIIWSYFPSFKILYKIIVPFSSVTEDVPLPSFLLYMYDIRLPKNGSLEGSIRIWLASKVYDLCLLEGHAWLWTFSPLHNDFINLTINIYGVCNTLFAYEWSLSTKNPWYMCDIQYIYFLMGPIHLKINKSSVLFRLLIWILIIPCLGFFC